MRNKFLILFVAFVGGLFAACSSDDNSVRNVPGEGESETPKAEVTLTLGEVGVDKVDFTVTSKNAVQIAYLLTPKSDESITTEVIFQKGITVEVNKTVEVTVNDLHQDSEYDLYLVAKGEDKEVSLIKHSFKTLLPKGLELVDGFMMYDDLDEATGLYRTNLMMSTKKMSQDGNGIEYKDVLIWLLTQEPLVKLTEQSYQLPFGKVAPLEGSYDTWKPLMYYVGKHVKGSDGKPNFQGTAWINFDKNKNEDYFVADDTKATSIEIVDNKDGSYTISGKLVDKTRGEELTFTYTDSKPVFGW